MGNGSFVRKELPKELEDKRAKGLCFRCNEKYTRGHVCKRKQLYTMEGEEDKNEQSPELEAKEGLRDDQLHEEELQISLKALTRSISYRTMRVRGNVKKKLIVI